MNIRQLMHVTEIARCRSINEAARQLYVSQPSLTASLQNLEQQLGFAVFIRTRGGVELTKQGEEFLAYANSVLEQMAFLEKRYSQTGGQKPLFQVSTQHYTFAVTAFASLLQRLDLPGYDFTLRETRTFEVIEDVKTLRSEIGILYRSQENQDILNKMLQENNLRFTPFTTANPHVFLSKDHPLAQKEMVTLEELEPYPYLQYEQGAESSFYYAEEVATRRQPQKTIRVSDRATLYNLLIGVNGYTLCSGLYDPMLNGQHIVPVPCSSEERMEIGYVENEKTARSPMAQAFMEEVERALHHPTCLSALAPQKGKHKIAKRTAQGDKATHKAPVKSV